MSRNPLYTISNKLYSPFLLLPPPWGLIHYPPFRGIHSALELCSGVDIFCLVSEGKLSFISSLLQTVFCILSNFIPHEAMYPATIHILLPPTKLFTSCSGNGNQINNTIASGKSIIINCLVAPLGIPLISQT